MELVQSALSVSLRFVPALIDVDDTNPLYCCDLCDAVGGVAATLTIR